MTDVDRLTDSVEDMSTTDHSAEHLGKTFHKTEQADDPVVFPDPPDDWQFNKFIGELADQIGNRDLEKIKYQCSGDGGISHTVLDSINDVRTLFKLLTMKKFLNRENMVYLQMLLKVAERIDLVEKVIDFSKEMGNTLYFYPATSEPENGYKYIKMPVQGKDYSNCTSDYIQLLKYRLSRVLCVPIQFIFIAGIDPSSSLLVTFMMPVEYVDLMQRRLSNGETYPELHAEGIDIIQIGERAFNITGQTDTRFVATEQQEKLSSVYQQLQTALKNLEISDLEVVRMSNEMNRIRNEQDQNMLAAKVIVRTFEEMIKKQEKETALQINMPELNNRVQEFEESLKTVTETNNSKQMVENLVNKHTEMMTSWMSVYFVEREHGIQSALRRQSLAMMVMEVQLNKYKFLASIELEKLEEELLAMIQSLVAKLKEEVVVEQVVEINETVLAILRKISRGLRHKEKQKLMKKYTWDDDDPIKADMGRDQSYFLAGIIYKEIQTKHKLIQYDQFISDLLTEVGRDDLRKSFLRLIKTSFPVKPQTATDTSPMPNTDNPQMWPVLTKMAGEVSEMHQRMMSVVGNFQTGMDTPLYDSKYFQTRDESTERGRTPKPPNSFADTASKA